MRYVDEYRDADLARRLAASIRRRVTRPVTIMEVCGGQTHAIVRFGVDELLPPEVELVHGPGCPVCVTPVAVLEKALAIASLKAIDPAILNAISDESTLWYLPSVSVMRKSITGQPACQPFSAASRMPFSTAGR